MSAAFEDFFYDSTDGLRLHARIYGRAHDGIPVVCLPGLTRNAHDFDALATTLSSDEAKPRQVVAFDYRGRGQSAYDPNWKNYTVPMETGDVITGLAALGISKAHFIGTSRGGLILHMLAAIRPDIIQSVILNDIGPVVEVAGLQHIKDYLGRAPRPTTIDAAVEAQKVAHGQEFSALNDADWRRMVEAIYREDHGRLVPDFDPALLTDLMTADLSKPLPDLWVQFDLMAKMPVMVIRGTNSRLLSGATVVEMMKRHPALVAIAVENQGHAPFLETGDLPALIASFLNEHDV